MPALRGLIVLSLLGLYRLARAIVAGLGLTAVMPPLPAAIVVLVCAALELQWLLRVLAALALWLHWHWPLWAAILASMPRLVLLLPGLITAGIARLRHPRQRAKGPAATTRSLPQRA